MKSLLRLTVLLALLAAAGLWFSLRSFRVFADEQQVAVVRCQLPPPGSTYRFLLEVTQKAGPEPGRREKFPMSGDQWAIGGDILKWEPWLAFLGAKPVHKLTWVGSRYHRASDALKNPVSVYDLNGGSQPPWNWLYRWGGDLPLVDAVYGNSAYVPARPGGRWGVFVTHSGYFIRPLAKREE